MFVKSFRNTFFFYILLTINIVPSLLCTPSWFNSVVVYFILTLNWIKYATFYQLNKPCICISCLSFSFLHSFPYFLVITLCLSVLRLSYKYGTFPFSLFLQSTQPISPLLILRSSCSVCANLHNIYRRRHSRRSFPCIALYKNLTDFSLLSYTEQCRSRDVVNQII